ncbi:unnamed protein product [Effrenium voratum]|uniref:PDZ domain-containing protein n=1 Tax=Effrenium voratum TaxID=2562239 RepID=A0AA36HLR3_9DINO|nr:unnamed protein product [Effrenium voratum]
MGKLGFTLLDFDEESVWVDQVLEMGTVPEWNEQNPLAKVATGTRILEVNGIKGDVNKIYEELKKKSSVLELLVESHGPETANPKDAPTPFSRYVALVIVMHRSGPSESTTIEGCDA